MKRAILTVAMLCGSLASAQAPPAQPAEAPKTLAATMNIYVFPTKGQVATQQSQDEAECYSWAVQSVGIDPFEAEKKAAEQQKQAAAQQQQIAAAGKGAGAKGAVGGAAAGALIGEIAGHDAGAAAGYGAAAGALVARRKAHEKQADATQQVQQQTQATQKATAEQVDNFKKAFSVCLEAKNYMVKY